MDSTLSLSEILTRQKELEDEAREILPGDTTVCSFDEGYVRQAVYACKTCTPDTAAGFCFACSISCHGGESEAFHEKGRKERKDLELTTCPSPPSPSFPPSPLPMSTDHEIIELFPKRAFKCDCRTSKLSHPCSLSQPSASSTSSSSKLPPNELNHYDKNFLGRFCICDADYDPQEEAENMVQCIVCEVSFSLPSCELEEREPVLERPDLLSLLTYPSGLVPRVSSQPYPFSIIDFDSKPDLNSNPSSYLPRRPSRALVLLLLLQLRPSHQRKPFRSVPNSTRYRSGGTLRSYGSPR